MLPMPFLLHSLVHLSNQLLSYINCEGLKLTRKQSLSSQDQCLGRDKSSRGLLEGPWECGWEGLDSAWGVGKLRLGHISRARHRCSEAATGAKTFQGINTTKAQGGRQTELVSVRAGTRSLRISSPLPSPPPVPVLAMSCT